jgi:hypothetical protein
MVTLFAYRKVKMLPLLAYKLRVSDYVGAVDRRFTSQISPLWANCDTVF